ncbi:hypothetical protein GGI26_004936 [Coemansia sp. RSA 1358]|nr:hypothetical protein GGI26_004936 [Coemansia sp. RSA 1358]
MSDASYGFIANVISVDHVHSGKKCTGALITDRIVVTTANCLLTAGHTWFRPELMSVLLGGSTDNAYKVRQALIADGYTRDTLKHNVGLLVLASPVPESVATPIKIYTGTFNTTIGSYVAGYGLTAENPNANPEYAQAAPLSILDNDHCRSYPHFDSATQLCAYGGLDNAVCRGDEGAPLLVLSESGSPAILAITSYTAGPTGINGLGCKDRNRFVYFEMGGSWAKWISTTADVPYEHITVDTLSGGTSDSNSGSHSDAGGVTDTHPGITASSADVGAISGPSVSSEASESSESSSHSSASSVVAAGSANTSAALAFLVATVLVEVIQF